MKLSTIALFAALSISGTAMAKTSYVTGDLKKIDKDNAQISIIEKSGEVTDYSVAPEVMSEVLKFKKGDKITLELETSKLDR